MQWLWADKRRVCSLNPFYERFPEIPGEGWSRRPGLNRQPADYESAALPLSDVGPGKRGSVREQQAYENRSPQVKSFRRERTLAHKCSIWYCSTWNFSEAEMFTFIPNRVSSISMNRRCSPTISSASAGWTCRETCFPDRMGDWRSRERKISQ